MDKCDVCGHETSYLEQGYGEHHGQMLCKLCDDRIYKILNLNGEVNSLKEGRAALVLAAGKCIALIDGEVSKGRCNKVYSLIRNTLNHELENLGIGL